MLRQNIYVVIYAHINALTIQTATHDSAYGLHKTHTTMAQESVMIVDRDAEEFVRLTENDIVVFVANSDGNSVFKYAKTESTKYNNAYLCIVLKEKEVVPIALSSSSILAPYGCEKLFVSGANLNKQFDTLPKRTLRTLVDEGRKVRISQVKSVEFTTKKGKKIDWFEYELVAVGGQKSTFTPSAEQLAQIDEFCVEYLARQNKKLQE